MKQLNNFILEKLKINSKSKIDTNFDPDNMNNEEVKIYTGKSNNIHKVLESIADDRNIYAYLLCKNKSLSECIKQGNSQNISYHFALDMLLDEILDYFYGNKTISIYIANGRIYIQEKGFSNYFFIYGLSESGYNKCEEYFDQLDWHSAKSNQDLSFFNDYNIFKEIKHETIK